jgi:hypothetical protein
MSIERDEQAAAARARRAAVAAALASIRAEGLEPSPEGLARLARVSDGQMTADEALNEALAPYRPGCEPDQQKETGR